MLAGAMEQSPQSHPSCPLSHPHPVSKPPAPQAHVLPPLPLPLLTGILPAVQRKMEKFPSHPASFSFQTGANVTNPLWENNRICFIQMPLLPARATIAQPKHRGRHEINSSHSVQGKFEIQIGMFSSYYKHWISSMSSVGLSVLLPQSFLELCV